MVMSTEDPRFAAIARLYGIDGLERLRAAHVAIVGVGGVGSWAAEAVARCGVCLLYTSPSPRDLSTSRMPSSA